MLNRPPQQGGDGIALLATIAALRARGVDAVHVWGRDRESLTGFDLAHCFHLDFDWAVENYGYARRAGLPYICTPIFYPEIGGVEDSVKAEILRGARAVLPFSAREAHELRIRFGAIDCTPIPNGTAPEFHGEPGPGRVGVCASDWVGSKNTRVINQACVSLGLPFGVFFCVPHERMAEEYRKYRVFATATPSDRMSLAVGEALCAGCRCIVSTANRGNEWYPGLQTIRPEASAAEWAARIREAYDSPDWDWTPNEAARRLTWDLVAEQLEREYQRARAGATAESLGRLATIGSLARRGFLE